MLAIRLYKTKNDKVPHGTHNMKLLLLLAQIWLLWSYADPLDCRCVPSAAYIISVAKSQHKIMNFIVILCKRKSCTCVVLGTLKQSLFFNFSAYAYIDDCGYIVKQTNQNFQTYIVLAFNYLNLFPERVTVKCSINWVFLHEHNSYYGIYL
jgi:hypothetical protein